MTARNSTGSASIVAGLCAGLLLAGFSAPALASPVNTVVAAAEQQLGGEVFRAERFRENGQLYVEVELLSGSQIVEAVFRVNGDQLVEIDTYNNQGRVTRVTRALNRANLTLTQATRIARNAVGGGGIIEAELRITANPQRNGQRYIVDLRNRTGEYEVIINSRTGNVVRVIDD